MQTKILIQVLFLAAVMIPAMFCTARADLVLEADKEGFTKLSVDAKVSGYGDSTGKKGVASGVGLGLSYYAIKERGSDATPFLGVDVQAGITTSVNTSYGVDRVDAGFKVNAGAGQLTGTGVLPQDYFGYERGWINGEETVGRANDDDLAQAIGPNSGIRKLNIFPTGGVYRRNKLVETTEAGFDWGIASIQWENQPLELGEKRVDLCGAVELASLVIGKGQIQKAKGHILHPIQGHVCARYSLGKKLGTLEADLSFDIGVIPTDGTSAYLMTIGDSLALKDIAGSGLGVSADYSKNLSRDSDGTTKQVDQLMFGVQAAY